MGNAKRRRSIFFKAHPFCCFCGGAELATTEDHVPARSVFDERKWPEGYNFPACDNCNRLTRQDEKVAAFLSRIKSESDGHQTPAQIAEMKRCLESMRLDYPDAYRSMKMSANDVRKFMKESGLTRPANTSYADVPVVSVGRPEFITPIRNFGIKLFCALHYKHAGKIVPADWNIAIRLLTNVQLAKGVLTEEMFKVLSGRPTLQRSRNELDDQFSYVFAIANETTTSAYLCKFRESFVLLGIVSNNPLPMEFDEHAEMGAFKGKPFRHGSRTELRPKRGAARERPR